MVPSFSQEKIILSSNTVPNQIPPRSPLTWRLVSIQPLNLNQSAKEKMLPARAQNRIGLCPVFFPKSEPHRSEIS